MNRRSVLGVMVMGVALVSAQAMYAAPGAPFQPAPKMFASSKMIKFMVRNDGATPLKVKAGDTTMTLEHGKPVQVSLPEGQQIVVAEATPSREAGSVLATVSSDLSGVTLSFQ